ncbi:MAG: hypothetical protein JKY45_08890 [Emcibacter sp.]|nr:hypothetical protein [Emcibacter sp.]
MATLAEKQAEIQERVLTLLGPQIISSPTAMREVYRYVAIKLVEGVEEEVIIDIAVHNKDTDDEMAVEIKTNIEPLNDPSKQIFIDWFEAQRGDANIVAYAEEATANGPGVVVPRTTLKVWILDPETDQIKTRRVFAWMPSHDKFIWKFITPDSI